MTTRNNVEYHAGRDAFRAGRPISDHEYSRDEAAYNNPASRVNRFELGWNEAKRDEIMAKAHKLNQATAAAAAEYIMEGRSLEAGRMLVAFAELPTDSMARLYDIIMATHRA